MRMTAIIVACALIVTPAFAQTTGVPGTNDLTVNGNGSGATSCFVQTGFSGPTQYDFAITGIPGDFVVMATNVTAGGCVPGALAFGLGNSLDLSPGLGFAIWYGSILGLPAFGPPGLPFATDVINSNGDWALTITTDIPPALSEISWQGAVIGPSHAVGFMMTQAHQFNIITVAPPTQICANASSITLIGGTLSDDGFFAYTFTNATGFPFYGTLHTNVYVNMNGNLTFCTGDSDFSPTELEMADDQPRIAPLWTDVTPSAATQGDVLLYDDGTTFQAEWFDVRHFGTGFCDQSNGWQDSNNACATLDYASGLIMLDIGDVRRCLPPFGGDTTPEDLIVGISPGFTEATCGTPGTNNTATVDLATGFVVNSYTGAPGDPIFEFFDTALTNPFDLSVPGIGGGSQITLSFVDNGSGDYTLF